MSMKQAGSNRKPSGGGSVSTAAGSSSGGGGGRHNMGRGRSSGKGPPPSISFDGIYANMRMVHILTSVVGSKCEVQVKNGGIYEGVFKTYSPKCDLVLDAAHRKTAESNLGPKREDIVESILFKSSDFVMAHFKDLDINYARRDAFTDSAISSKVNGEHKEKDLEPWDGGEGIAISTGTTTATTEELEALETDVSNGWDPNDMFRYNEENYGVVSTYDSSLSSYTVPLERDNSEEFLRREARATQLAEEIESSAQYKARVALENDDRTEEEKYTAVQRNSSEREGHGMNPRENKYIPPGQRNRDVMSWGSHSGRQNSPRMGQSGSGPISSRTGSHISDFSPNSAADQRVVNGGVPWPSPCPSPSSRPPSRYQSGPNSLPPRAATPTRPPSRPSRPPSHPSAHGSSAPVSTMPKRVSSEGPPRMSPKAQRHPRGHRISGGRGTISGGLEFVPHSTPGDTSTPPPVARNNSSGGTWSSVVSGVPRLSPKAHRPRSPRQSSIGNAASGAALSSPQAGTLPTESVPIPLPATSPTPASPASNRAVTPSCEAKDSRLQDQRQNSPAGNRENIKPSETSSFNKPESKVVSPMASEQRKQLDDLKKFKNDFRLPPSSSPDTVDQLLNKNRDGGEKSRELLKEKMAESIAKESVTESSSTANTSSSGSKPTSPSISPSINSTSELKKGPEVTSQGVQTSGPGSKQEKDERDEKKENTSEQVRKSTLNPNAKEFNPRTFAQPKPSTTPTSPRPQAQPSPSMVAHQQPTPVYTQPVCFAPNMMYPVPVSPGVQPLYPIPMTPMPVSQAKTYRAVPNIPQRQDQHHQNAMIHPASAAGPPIVATPPAYSAQYVTYSPQQFPNQPLMQHVQHYQSQHPHVYSPVIQGNARMMAPPTHAQPGLVSSSATQYGAHEQTHAMYVSTGSLAQQYAHPNAALHPHPPHPQPSATPTGQQQSQHGSSHPAPSPVQHHQHQAAQALHLANPQQQSAIYHAGLAPTPPSMTPGSNTQSPQNSFPTAQQTVFAIHPSHVQPAYTNPPHMAHVQQAHVQSGMVPSHPTAHPPMMLMTAQPPGVPQAAIAQSALQPIPVSTTTHFPYMTHPPVQAHHQQQL
ncbi:ataxin-2 isoform X7 [Rhinatrema bivittatum]|uniref:ataxin-2 isoform X7 n=1 Tax=Rhinatrema bivittatum TaxID=194408 RepID=UPI001125D644|nr:ataxin-2 isoform X7 [Rhinatrema bivittatum]